jgi:uncharacterized membrane protein
MLSQHRYRKKSDFGLEDAESDKLSFAWKLIHSLLCIIGGAAFFCGSVQYFPWIDKSTRGAGLFTIGGGCFFIADSMDMYITCTYSGLQQAQSVEYRNGSRCLGCSTDRALQSKVNVSLGTAGSLCYFIGCILFIPSLGNVVLGDVLFIPGSVMIMVSQAWKLYRTGCMSSDVEYSLLQNGQKQNQFAFTNLLSDAPLLCADVSLGIGAVAFLVGAILFLPQYEISDEVTTWGVYAFIVGSVLFIATGMATFYRYFCTAAV